MLTNSHDFVRPSGDGERAYLESLVREEFERCRAGEKFDDMKRRMPFSRDLGLTIDDDWVKANPCHRHLGLYAYQADLLAKLGSLPLGRYEQIEKLEQLRVLEAGYDIHCAVTDDPTIGVDTPKDAEKFEQWLG